MRHESSFYIPLQNIPIYIENSCKRTSISLISSFQMRNHARSRGRAVVPRHADRAGGLLHHLREKDGSVAKPL